MQQITGTRSFTQIIGSLLSVTGLYTHLPYFMLLIHLQKAPPNSRLICWLTMKLFAVVHLSLCHREKLKSFSFAQKKKCLPTFQGHFKAWIRHLLRKIRTPYKSKTILWCSVNATMSQTRCNVVNMMLCALSMFIDVTVFLLTTTYKSIKRDRSKLRSGICFTYQYFRDKKRK